MKYAYTETTLETIAKADHIFEWPIYRPHSHQVLLTAADKQTVYGTYAPAGAVQLQGKKFSKGIIEVCKNGERYMKWCPELHEGMSNAAKERQKQQVFNDWLAHVPPDATFSFLANGPVEVHDQRFSRLIGYHTRDVVLDAIVGKAHYVTIIDGKNGRDLATVRGTLPGEYEDVWETLQHMVSSGMVAFHPRKKPKVGLERIPGTVAEKRHVKDWYLMIYHHPDSVDRAPKSL
jgi:hypothetical protein